MKSILVKVSKIQPLDDARTTRLQDPIPTFPCNGKSATPHCPPGSGNLPNRG